MERKYGEMGASVAPAIIGSMRLSLSARVTLGLATQIVVFGGAVGYLVFAADAIFDRLSVLKDEMEPVGEDLRKLVVDLKEVEGLLVARSSGERAQDALWRLRLFERVGQDAEVLERVALGGGTPSGVPDGLLTAAQQLKDLRDGDRLVARLVKSRVLAGSAQAPRSNAEAFALAVERLREAQASGHPEEAAIVAAEVRRMCQFARAVLQRTSHDVLAAMRDANLDLLQRRVEISYALVVVPASAMVVAVIVLWLTLRALRPVRRLTGAVRRLASGEVEGPNPEDYAGELRELAEALAGLGSALRDRGADLERKTNELMRAERLAVIGRMASVVAHEVRNPLNSVNLNLDLLREMLARKTPPDDPKVVSLLDAIQREVDRLSEITGEYLKFGRLPRGVLAPCDVARIVRETRAFMDGEFTNSGVAVEVRVPERPVMVLADEAQLHQALVNVLRNAVEAMPEGGRLGIEVSDVGERVQVSVRDTGPGIPEDFRQRLFEPFATTKPRGTGLGLAFVQQVMHECGGEVGVESAPGQGTCVRFWLRRAV